jgi:hypothetical protein
MSILFDGTKSVKSNPSFGRGLLRSTPTYRDEVSAADRQWAAANLNATATDFMVPDLTDRALEDGAEQARWDDLMRNGIRPY